MRLVGRLRTVGALFSHFARREKLVLIPLLAVLLLAACRSVVGLAVSSCP